MIFTLLGTAFLIIGVITLLGIITGLHFGTPLGWQYWGYAVMNFLAAWGFFNLQYWLLPALLLNWLGGAALTAVKFFIHKPDTHSLTFAGISFCFAGLVFLVVYTQKRIHLSEKRNGMWFGAAFIVTWAAIACYTIATLIT